VCFLDIECPSPDKFPEPELAEQVINLIVCHDSISGKKTAFGLKAYDDGVTIYHHCKSEHDLLKKLINYLTKEGFDVYCGWNSNGFDIPYLVNRITFELGKEWADKLSPMGRIYEKLNREGRYGEPQKEYVIDGVSCLDYMVMYQKFNPQKQASYSLNNIGEEIIEENKVEYDGSLWDLARNDWKTYVEYCIKDVDIVVKLDKKLGYISLLRFLAYTGLCSMENAIKTLPAINGAIAIRARHRGEFIPTFIRPVDTLNAPGGFVADTVVGFVDDVVSFDANSLYPSVMISLNLSPETKIGRVEKVDDIIKIYHVSGKVFELSKENFVKFIKEENAALTKAGFLFSQKRKGVIPEFLDNLYTKRKDMKSRMLEAKKDGDKEAEAKFDSIQYAYKIHLNSLYGYMLNKYAPLYDFDIGTSVTLTGQAVNKKSRELFKQYIASKVEEPDYEKYLVAGDTDSLYVSLSWAKKLGIHLLKDGNINSEFIDLCDDLENFINDGINKWAIKELRSDDPRFFFKRESICDNAIFLKKKYYVLHVLNDEGVDVDEYKYKGIDVVKTTMPKKIKPYVKGIIEHMMKTKSLKETNKMFLDAYEKFKELGISEIAKIVGMKNYEEYSKKCNDLNTAKGMPNHLKAAYFHDLIVEKNGLSSKYNRFKSGDKVKVLYVEKPNKYNIDFIGFGNKYPEEFEGIFKVDYEKMFDKIFYTAIERVYDAVDWKLRKPSENVVIELEDLFGED
jgi:DNA polymerase elongation subunit (family B)